MYYFDQVNPKKNNTQYHFDLCINANMEKTDEEYKTWLNEEHMWKV